MPRFILTGAPGAGKTALLRLIEREGFGVVEEAATDVIALRFALGQPAPWQEPGFVEAIVALQRQRELGRIVAPGEVVFFDRSPVCTLASSRYSGLEPAAEVTAEVERVLRLRVFEPAVFFVENLGSIEKTAARRISFADSLRFERVHRETYRELGFELSPVPAGGVRERADQVLAAVRDLTVRRTPPRPGSGPTRRPTDSGAAVVRRRGAARGSAPPVSHVVGSVGGDGSDARTLTTPTRPGRFGAVRPT